MAVSSQIERAIREVVNARFANAQISDVKIQSGEDSDGDPVLKIFVVFEPTGKSLTLDPQEMASLARHIMTRLATMQTQTTEADMFPMVSFVSQKDAAKLNLAAA